MMNLVIVCWVFVVVFVYLHVDKYETHNYIAITLTRNIDCLTINYFYERR